MPGSDLCEHELLNKLEKFWDKLPISTVGLFI